MVVRKGDKMWKPGSNIVYRVVNGRKVSWVTDGRVATYEYPSNRRTFWKQSAGLYVFHVDTGESVTGYTNEPLAPPLLPLLAEVCK